MKGIFKNLFVLGFGAMVSGAVFSDQWEDVLLWEGLETGGTEELRVITATAANPAGCSNTNSYFLSSTNPSYKAQVAFILSAYHAEANMKVLVSSSTCYSAHPKILGVQLIRE